MIFKPFTRTVDDRANVFINFVNEALELKQRHGMFEAQFKIDQHSLQELVKTQNAQIEELIRAQEALKAEVTMLRSDFGSYRETESQYKMEQERTTLESLQKQTQDFKGLSWQVFSCEEKQQDLQNDLNLLDKSLHRAT
jgi:cell division protein FtsB